jgi:ATP-binding cassette, subfamily B, bacterial HlyB/CyaB
MTPPVTKEAANDPHPQLESAQPVDAGIAALSLIAAYYRIAADPAQLRHRLALREGRANAEDLVRAANLLNLKSRIIRGVDTGRLGAFLYQQS